jgi:hypothetical protein
MFYKPVTKNACGRAGIDVECIREMRCEIVQREPIMQRTLLALLAVAALGVPPPTWSKGQTVRIEIRGDGLASTLEIDDPRTAGSFDIWNGPGVNTNGRPYHAVPSQPAGHFVDWSQGVVVQRPPRMRRYEVVFHIRFDGTGADGEALYHVAYEIDAASGRGYIYLPRWKNELIAHDVDGSWLHASSRWDEVIGTMISRHATAADSGRLLCTIGTGVRQRDGTIELHLALAGDRRATFRYHPTDDAYASVEAHLGDIATGEEKAVSCWPPRI